MADPVHLVAGGAGMLVAVFGRQFCSIFHRYAKKYVISGKI
jgi:hypothetical protein